jgi:cyclic beta-1,2-glucan synthetase
MMVTANETQGLLDAEARQLAEKHVLSEHRLPSRRTALAAIGEYRPWLEQIRRRLADPDPGLAKAAEWLLDNEYLIARAARQVRDHLTPGFHARLPVLGGALAGQLRVRSVADALLLTSRLQLSSGIAAQFVQAYQERTPLTMAELWALPIFLRLHCLNVVAAAIAEIAPALRPPFPLDAVDHVGVDATERVGRAVSTLRTIDAIPWKDFFCRTSRVEAILSGDPAGVYQAMDFDTRDRYRKAVEALVDASPYSEVDVADRVVRYARQWTGRSVRHTHVGYWLIDAGREEFERTLGCRPGVRAHLVRWTIRHAPSLYLSAIVATTAIALAVPIAYLITIGARPHDILLAAAFAALPASTLAITLVQWLLTNILPPRTLPKLDFETGVPQEHRAAVVVPTLVASPDDARHQVERLEIHYLANPDGTAQFVLLSDFTDAAAERLPADDAVLTALRSEVQRLNAKYPSQPFHVLHRPRRFNPCEGIWMGWERKRGKLEEFNRLLTGAPTDAFLLREGRQEGLGHVRYVVTLDADTMLPRGALARLIGTLAHPLNCPEFDPATGRVCAGYTVIQPRVEILPEIGSRSALARWFTGDTAIDIYSHAVSDIYQDLFGCGIYVGKGAYAVDAFRRSLDGRVPDNALLSHDLFEGLHGRVGLATDILLYEGFPTHYVEFARRAHRWIRGDWQLLPWLLPRVPGPNGARLPSRFTWLDRWKIADNLRRSLLAPGLLAMLTAGWLWLPGSPLLWTVLGCAAPGAHVFTDLVTGFARGRRRTAITAPFQRLTDQAGRWVLLLLFLPADATIALDAIGRTLVRLLWTRRHLLEWTSAAHAANTVAAADGRGFVWREMIVAPLYAILLGIVLALGRPGALGLALPFLATWCVAPEVAYRLSRRRTTDTHPLRASHRHFVRLIARRTWLYFETFAGPADQWLPPDNYQETPRGEIAHRTSPTNIGMMLVSSIAAYDLGYLGSLELATRARHVLDTLERLERHKGHFFNWYHTRTLEPLVPRYVSTVDSGNLALSLIALKEACRQLDVAPLLAPQRSAGILDVLYLLSGAVARLPGGSALSDRIAGVRARMPATDQNTDGWREFARALHERELNELDRAVREALQSADPPPDLRTVHEVRVWLERLHHDVRSTLRDEDVLCPWLSVLAQAPSDCQALAAQVAGEVPATMPLSEAAVRCRQARQLARAASNTLTGQKDWIDMLAGALERGEQAATALQNDLRSLSARAETMAMAMDFAWLYDKESRLLHIGYNVTADRIDPHHYDLLASEARLASLFAIAKGDVPVEHWFHLGRPITSVGRHRCLISWGGSMFEYLMPSMFVRSEPGTLLAESERLAVDVQSRYAHRLNVPWGMSESAFGATDSEHVYQYRSFGVADLRFGRGLTGDVVIAPYATALAAIVNPEEAVENLRRLHALGLVGEFGFYDAADFTAQRRPPNQPFTIVRCYMAHHQGMILAAFDNALCDGALVHRVASDARLRAVSLLLHERVPREAPEETVGVELPARPVEPPQALEPWSPVTAGAFPEMHFLGNGRLASWISDSGSGTLRWQGWSVTRWIPDAAHDDTGLWLYIRDEETGALWSATRQPTAAAADEVDVVFYPHLVEYHRRTGDLATRLEVLVGATDDIEIRRLTIINDGPQARRLTVASYAEVTLADPAGYERHPAFSKLFVRSEPATALHGVLFERRPRRPEERPPVLLHWLISDDVAVVPAGLESDRRTFLGRGGTARHPKGLDRPASGTTGYTLDPILSLRESVVVPAHGTVRMAFATAVAASRESVRELAERYQTINAVEWAIADAQAETTRDLVRLGLTPASLSAVQRLGALMLFPRAPVRARADLIAGNRQSQPALWGLGVSGDLPLLVVKLPALDDSSLLDELVSALAFWRRRQLLCDLVVLHEGASGYQEPLANLLRARLQAIGWHDQLGQRAGVHAVHADHVKPQIQQLLEAAAHAVLDARRGPLAAQLTPAHAEPVPLPRFTPAGAPRDQSAEAPPLDRPGNLRFDNGFGGFSTDGREYIIHLAGGEATPAPWCNVLANSAFGSLVTEAGLGFTWSENSAERRLTPWTNDPVSDTPGEVLYVRDEETADVWSPTPRPAPAPGPHQIRHGAGYTIWRSHSHALAQDLTVFVPPDDPVKIVRLRLHNHASRPRRLTVTYFAHWILGASRQSPLLVPEYDGGIHALLARDPWTPEFAERTAFLAADRLPHGVTADRVEFLGREGTLAMPAALERWGLSGRVQAGGDACAALQVHVDLAAGAVGEVTFFFGDAANRPQAASLVDKYRAPGAVDAAWQRLAEFWDTRLDALQVETPDPALDMMLNRWLLYQTLASRLLARTGFYQSSGAIGFRDQLQDTLALLFAEPGRCRTHLLECAAHQFEEGDVLHWWHPPSGRGVRTRCSDDLLWLPYVMAQYVDATGDTGILDESIPFLKGRALAPHEDDLYARFPPGDENASLLDHCERALERGVTRGPHGLPLIGAGDWNDGMNRVGRFGRGESVWLAWFAVTTMHAFAAICRRRNDDELADRWTRRARELEHAVDDSAWDGEWYCRAFDDDGNPWGSRSAEECQIDSTAQSWAVISGAAPRSRAERAMHAVEERLISQQTRLIRLLTPPFARTSRDPGYIKAYPPGVRENGGQYTHAAVWVAWAYADLGDGEAAARALDLLNPIRRCLDRTAAERYGVEPYVLAADIYDGPGYAGRGGWTWYTGSAAWMWRFAIERVIGLRLEDGALRIEPCLPKAWRRVQARLRRPTGTLVITIERSAQDDRGAHEIRLDGGSVANGRIPLPADGREHHVEVRLASQQVQPPADTGLLAGR